MISVSVVAASPRTARMFRPDMRPEGALRLSSNDHARAIGQRRLSFLKGRGAVAGGCLNMDSLKKIDPQRLALEFRGMPMRETEPSHEDYLKVIVGRLASSDNLVSIYGDHHGDALSAIQHLFSGQHAQFRGLVSGMLQNVHLDLSGAVFDGMFMKDIPLIGADFRNGSFRDVVMRNVNLYGAHFSFADLSRAVILDSNMPFVDMEGTVLQDMIVARTKLTENFSGAASNADGLIFIDCPKVTLK
jgi:hypothetical protein